MKLLHLVHTPRHSGAEVLVRDLCLEHVKNGVQCAIAAFDAGTPEFQAELDMLRSAGVRIFTPNAAGGRLRRVTTYVRAIRAFRPDAVFGHSLLPSIYGRVAVMLSLSRAKFFNVLHSGSDDYKSVFVRLVERALRIRTNSVITVSEDAAMPYSMNFGTNIPINLISNGVNVSSIRAANNIRDQIRTKFGLSRTDVLILQTGRIVNMKNQRLSAAAAIPLLRTNFNIQLWFAGLTEDDRYVNELRECIDCSGLKDRIRIIGARTDIPHLLAAADLFLMPSKFEAQGMALLEAMASGLQIIASDIPAFAFARGMPGVTLIKLDDFDRYQSVMKEGASNTVRHIYDVSAYDVRIAAIAYENMLAFEENKTRRSNYLKR